MPDKGFKTITVPELLHDKIAKKAKKEDKSITVYATEVLASYMEADEKLSRYAPFIEVIGLEGNAAILKDNKLGRIVEVYLHKEELMCIQDQSKDCVHVTFCQALPQLRRVARG